jgi:NADPH-dependent glutamate synthase beta subunit-like oxidoreductase
MQISRYLREIRRGEFARAEAVIREAAPFPRVLGQICFHPCEEACLRAELSEPLSICGLKRAALEHAGPGSAIPAPSPRPDTGKSVAIVGAGPAGLTAAWFLRLKGHAVTVIDAQDAPGGWLRDGIPRYRLSAQALDADVQEILAIGIESRMGDEVGRDLGFDELLSDHDAVLVAAGARRGKRLACDGTELGGVELGLDLLRSLASVAPGEEPSFDGEKVVVIGGGNVAIDVARAALRLGPAQVHMYCLEQRHEMPAHDWEIAEAEREGIVIHPGWGPLRFVGEDSVERADFQQCVSVFDEKGRFAPVLDDGVTCSEGADRVLIAIGQELAIEFLEDLPDLSRTPAGGIVFDPGSLQTSVPRVFVAGEVISGPASAVEAVGQGRRAAASIDLYLGGDGDIYFPLLDETPLDEELGGVADFFDLGRAHVPRLSDAEAVGGFELIEGGLSASAAVQEAQRCLRCDLRIALRPVPAPPDPWLELTAESVAAVPSSEGVYQLLGEDKVVYAISGVSDLRAALEEVLATTSKAEFFLYDEDPMFSKRESELIQEYLQQHGCMPPGEGEDDLDDLF